MNRSHSKGIGISVAAYSAGIAALFLISIHGKSVTPAFIASVPLPFIVGLVGGTIWDLSFVEVLLCISHLGFLALYLLAVSPSSGFALAPYVLPFLLAAGLSAAAGRWFSDIVSRRDKRMNNNG